MLGIGQLLLALREGDIEHCSEGGPAKCVGTLNGPYIAIVRRGVFDLGGFEAGLLQGHLRKPTKSTLKALAGHRDTNNPPFGAAGIGDQPQAAATFVFARRIQRLDAQRCQFLFNPRAVHLSPKQYEMSWDGLQH
jgi:hypothetical protein